ncbi:hypothetical protein [Chelativorans sp. AA-79]|uniref:hypothetical protein n=1 Tax=Chelativorans sp. AA-79 TaxID=3028735 RepID=UPI0023F780C9|nr:hypothetical protein [Chelativorans sp. AA-79]WEX07357.1 hypothetical protein PVE73_14625 [Chelativorans sp. AA-79]
MEWAKIAQYFSYVAEPGAANTFIIGAVGAFFGAVGAQVIASRFHRRQMIVRELNAVNGAMTHCFAITNHLFSLKKDYISQIHAEYMRERGRYLNFLEEKKNHTGPQPLAFNYHADLRTLPNTFVNPAPLERLVFEAISFRGLGLATAVALFSTLDELDALLAERNELAREIRQIPPDEPEYKVNVYFGADTANGVTDQRYYSCMEGLASLTDHAITFSMLLADKLYAHGKRLRLRGVWRSFLIGLPRVDSIDWSTAESDGLIPRDVDSTAFVNAFQPAPGMFLKLWRRLAKR